MQKIAIVFGVTGQDGSYLSELLLSKGYLVIGVERRSSVDTHERLGEVMTHPNFRLVEGDLTDATGVHDVVRAYQPDEVYNLAAQSHVGTSFTTPAYTFQVDACGVLNVLEAVRQSCKSARVYQASTSELFGDTTEAPQNEETRFRPTSPYAVAKLAAHCLVGLYRKAYGIHASAGILFNHESMRRGNNFVTQRIAQYVGHLGRLSPEERDAVAKLDLGNMDAKRDWGHAADYVEAMWLMLQQDKPDDYVIATGETHSVAEFCEAAFRVIGEQYQHWVQVDITRMRPADVNLLCGDASKARQRLGWAPKVKFEELVREMVMAAMVERK